MGLIIGGAAALAFAALTFTSAGANGLGPIDAALLALLAPAGLAMLGTGIETSGHRKRQRAHWQRIEAALGAPLAPPEQAARTTGAAGVMARDPNLAKIIAANAAYDAAEKERAGG